MNAGEKLINEAISLPVEIRTKIVERLLQSMNPINKKLDELWAEEAEKRVEEIRTGDVETVPGKEVFKKVRDRLNS